ncbi:MAG: helix-turn-helix transcriptional regulator [Solirubrobacteraceae bacterium]|nr:helix-turn-helix transcriptional regulator [Solirubrobacteraceae bacterium]
MDLVGDKWTLLIVRDLAAGPRRFVELQRVLPGISTEQLRSRLNRMVADGLLTRQRYREVPPRVDYELTERAQALLPVLGALARWGYQWAWDGPRGEEAIDIGAIFRVAPGLLEVGDARGLVELTVVRPDGDQRSYAIGIDDDGVTIEEREAPEAEAQIAGAEADWIRALGPKLDRDALRVAGDERLAMTVLNAVGGADIRATAGADVTA